MKVLNNRTMKNRTWSATWFTSHNDNLTQLMTRMTFKICIPLFKVSHLANDKNMIIKTSLTITIQNNVVVY